jgi:hypothetical protein
VFGLIRLLVTMVFLAVVAWFAVTVPLGKRTLWQHIGAIFATQEAKDLAEGTKEEAAHMAERMREGLRRDAGLAPGKAGDKQAARPKERAQPPLEERSDKDRAGLEHLVHDKAHGRPVGRPKTKP